MARVVGEQEWSELEGASPDLHGDTSMARMFGAAVALLLVGVLVTSHTTEALVTAATKYDHPRVAGSTSGGSSDHKVTPPTGSTTTTPGSTSTTGSTSVPRSPLLGDDTAGRPLFQIGDLGFGSVATRCVSVTYRGLPAQIGFAASSTGSLVPDLEVEVLVGSGGSYASCSGFHPAATAYFGPLSGLAVPMASPDFTSSGRPTTRTFEVRLSMQQPTINQGATVTFSWVATPG